MALNTGLHFQLPFPKAFGQDALVGSFIGVIELELECSISHCSITSQCVTDWKRLSQIAKHCNHTMSSSTFNSVTMTIMTII